MRVANLCEIVKFMCFSALCIVMYGAMKIYGVKICATYA